MDNVEVLRRSRPDIPIHLDYIEQDRSEEELSDDEMVLEDEVIEIDDDEEHLSPAQKRDAVSGRLSESSSSGSKKADSSSTGSPIEHGSSVSDQNNNNFLEEVMEDHMKIMY